MIETLPPSHLSKDYAKAESLSPWLSRFTLVLIPLDKSHFETKTLELSSGQHVKLGRPMSSSTLPSPFNGLFDSKVLSRTHAEVWNGEGRVFIKDRKSINGTFINGERLSGENSESDPRELKGGERLEFGIDVIEEIESGESMFHQKVSCLVILFPVSMSQVDCDVLQHLKVQRLGRRHTHDAVQRRRASMTSLGSLKKAVNGRSNSLTLPHLLDRARNNESSKRSDQADLNTELLLSRLEFELHRSKCMEAELQTTLKLAYKTIDSLCVKHQAYNDTKNTLLQKQLRDTQQRLSAYETKCRLQDKVIVSARNELSQLRTDTKSTNDALTKAREQLDSLRSATDNERKQMSCVIGNERDNRAQQKDQHADLELRMKSLRPRIHASVGDPTRWLLSSMLQTRYVHIFLGFLVAVLSNLVYIHVSAYLEKTLTKTK